MDESTVQDDFVVSLDYTLRVAGEVLDTSVGEEPILFIQGRGHIIPGLEKALYGMKSGDEKEVVLQPEDGYGEYDPEARMTVDRSDVSEAGELAVVPDRQDDVAVARELQIGLDGLGAEIGGQAESG